MCMKLAVTLAAQPDHIAGALIIRVVTLRLSLPAELTRLARELSSAKGILNGQVGAIALGICFTPLLLASKGLVTHAPSPSLIESLTALSKTFIIWLVISTF